MKTTTNNTGSFSPPCDRLIITPNAVPVDLKTMCVPRKTYYKYS